MTQSISAATSQPKIALTKLFHFERSEDEAVFEAREDWLEQLNQIPDDKRHLYRPGIDLVVQELKDKCIILKSEGWKSSQIISELSKTISLYNTSYALFAQKTASYNAMKLAEEQKHASLGEQFRRAVGSFKAYAPPEHTPTDPYEAQAQFEALVVLGTVHTVGTALQLTGATIAEGAKKACKLTKTTETACRATLDFGKKVVDAIPIDIRATIQNVQARGGASLTNFLEERYKFPREQARQLAHQNMDDLLIVSTAGVTGVASSLAIKTGKFFLNKQAPAAAATASEGASSATAATAATQKPVNLYLGTSGNFVTEGSTATSEKFANASFGSNTNFVLDKWPLSETQLPHGLGTQPSASGARSALAVETAQQPFPIGNPTRVDTTFERLKDHIESSEWGASMETAIDNEQGILNLLVPALSPEGKKVIESIPFRNPGMSSGDYSTILTDMNNKFIRKEFDSFSYGISEFMGLQFFRSLELNNTALSQPIAFWIYKDKATLIKTSLPGNHLQEWMSSIGKLPTGSQERVISIRELEKMAFFTGRSTGELQTKGSHLPPLAESELSDATGSTILRMGEEIGEADCQLSNVGKQFITDPEEFLAPIYKKFESDPGPISYGFGGNIESSEFLFNPGDPRPFACLNTKHVTSAIDNKGMPLQFVSEEYALFQRLFLCDGFEAGLEFFEIKRMLEAFERGYRSEYRGPAPTLAGSQLYDLYGSLQAIHDSSLSLQLTENLRMHRLVDSQIKELDQKLRIYSSTPGVNAPSQRPNTILIP